MKWFGDIIVRAVVQGRDLFRLGVLNRKDYNRDDRPFTEPFENGLAGDIWKAKIEQRVGTEVDPVVSEAVGARDINDRHAERLGHRAHRLDAVGGPLAEQVEILGRRARNESAQDEVPTPDENDLVVEPAGAEELPQRLHRCLELGSSD